MEDIIGEIIGKHVAVAEYIARNNDLVYRITEIDDKVMAITTDFVIDRLNFKIRNNIVIDATIG